MNDNHNSVEQFVTKAEQAGAQVQVINRTEKELEKTLLSIIPENQSVAYVVPALIPAKLFENLNTKLNLITNPNVKQLEKLNFGLTEAFAGVIRSGSICIKLTDRFVPEVSLFAWQHVALLPLERLVPRPRDVFRFPESEGDNFIFITGPSATADMGELVRGAHGPAKLHIILLK